MRMNTMNVVQKFERKDRKWILLAIMMLLCFLGACSLFEEASQDSEEGVQTEDREEQGTEDELVQDDGNMDEEEISVSVVSEVKIEKMDIGNSEVSVFTAELPRSRIMITGDVEDSDLNMAILQALDDFEAITTDGGTTLTLPDHILFDFDSYELSSDSSKAIEQLLQIVEISEGDVVISGHTDNKGTPEYNQELSEKRAQAVVEELVANGADESRLIAEGYGETKPVARNAYPDGRDDPEGRQKNRRVEVVVKGF